MIIVFDNHELMIYICESGLDPIESSLFAFDKTDGVVLSILYRGDGLMSHIHVLATQPLVITIKNWDGSKIPN